MKYLVRRANRLFVARQTIPGSVPPTTYYTLTPDPQDAHDFGSKKAATHYIRERDGTIVEVEQDGYWPLQD